MKPILLAAALSLTACSAVGSGTSGLSGAGGGTRGTTELIGGAPSAHLQVALFDAPIAGMQGVKVNIAIDGVQLTSALGPAYPFFSNPKPQVVNLLDLQSHSQDFNGTAPAGSYSGVRMLIDAASSNVKIGNFTIPIIWGTPGNATTSSVIAVDFPCAFTLTGVGAPPKLSLDFNVLQSVKFSGGAIYVQPKVVASNAAAQVSGHVKNAAGKAVATATVLAMDALGHVVNSTVTAQDGSYTMHALDAGVYTIQVNNAYVTATGDSVTAVGSDAGAAPSTTVILSPNDNVHLPDLTD